MKLLLLGISFILFAIAFLLTATGEAQFIGLFIAFIGLILSVTGAWKPDK